MYCSCRHQFPASICLEDAFLARIQVHIGSEKIGCGLPQVLDGSRLQGQCRSLEVRPRLKLTGNISVTIDIKCVCIYLCAAFGVCTSSTAQGGGSFRNRKPIGEVGCCESRVAERTHWWTERWLELCFLEWLQWLQWSPHHNCLM